MILVRVESESVGPIGMNADTRKERIFSLYDAATLPKIRKTFEAKGLGDTLGCWFAPALARRHDELDVITYANEIIASREELSGNKNKPASIRIVGLIIDDVEAEQYRISNIPASHPAMYRCHNADNEYLLPKDMPQHAELILRLNQDERLTEERYLQAVKEFALNSQPDNKPSSNLDFRIES